MKKALLILIIIPLIGIAQNSKEIVAINQVKAQKKANLKEEKIAEPKCVSGDCKNGKGEMKYSSGVYNGEWKDGLRSGNGTFIWDNGDIYKGAWVEDRRHGYGEYLWKDGSLYKGNYSQGVRSGFGLYFYTNGNIYEGTWQNNLKHGIANFYYESSVNMGGKYFNNEYVSGTGITQESYKYKPTNNM